MCRLLQERCPKRTLSFTSPQNSMHITCNSLRGRETQKAEVSIVLKLTLCHQAKVRYKFLIEKNVARWILDSRASDHIICSLDYFTTCTKVKELNIKLPNGDYVPVSHIGTVKIASLLLLNVLYMPIFNFNLISVSKLTSSN